MSLSIGIVGLPNVGKSTLFNALTKNNVLAANYPFATIEPNTGIIPIPDPRLEKLAKLSNSAKTIPATIKFVDIAGLVAGAHKGEGMGNAFLSHIREVDAIAQVVRVFQDNDVQHVNNRISPEDDIDLIKTEMMLADLQSIEKRLPKLAKEAKGDIDKRKQHGELESIKQLLENGKLPDKKSLSTDYQLLTTKPIIYVFNIDEGHITDDSLHAKLKSIAPVDNIVFISAKIEAELSELDPEDADDLMVSYGIVESGLDTLARTGFRTLGLQSFLTTGEKETRSWVITKGSTAPQAAGVIHGDFEKGFIAAQVIDYNDLVEAGSEATAKKAGKVRTEGKEYIMRPNDVVEFRFNV